MKREEVLKAAQEYVDKQLEVMYRYGQTELPQEDYETLVDQIVEITIEWLR